MMMPWSSAFAINNLLVSPGQLPFMFMVGGITALIITPLVGRLSDKKDKFKVFMVAALWMIVIVLVYTHLTPVHFGIVLLVNVLLMIGIMSRLVPAMALVSALPQLQNRGAFMSINSSLQQIAGGIAAAIGGMIVVQQTKTSPLQHYDILGYVIVVILMVNIVMVYRVSQVIKRRQGVGA